MDEKKLKKTKYGRKKLTEQELLSERIIVRFKRIDYEMLKHKAMSAGKSLGPFIRELAIKKISDIKIISKTDAINTNQIKKVGVNLNQISKNLNTYKYQSLPEFIIKDLDNSLKELKSIIKKI